MNFLILGDGAEELAWARAIAGDARHRIVAAYPGFDAEEVPSVPRSVDFEEAMARAGVEAALVGGGLDVRGEWLRRVAAAGWPAICLHPPGDDAEAYYQVALSRQETGAVVIPDLPLRLHPAFPTLLRAARGQEVGGFRGLRIEWTGPELVPGEGDLARHVFPRLVDGVRALIGEVEAITATGDPPGPRPTENLVVHLRGPEARRAEVRIEDGPPAPVRVAVTGAEGALALEADPTFEGPSHLIRRSPDGGEIRTDLGPWDPHAAILAVLDAATAGVVRDARPNLLDGTRAMELAEATVRSLRRGRTVDLHYGEISEVGTFKGVMTSIGCVLILAALVILPLALIGPPLGYPGTIYLAYAIPPILIAFILLQLLRFAARSPGKEE